MNHQGPPGRPVSLLPPCAAQREDLQTMSDNGEICEKSPAGMVALTSSEEKGTITVNGVDIELGSVAFLTMADLDTMIIANIEGSVEATAAPSQARALGAWPSVWRQGW